MAVDLNQVQSEVAETAAGNKPAQGWLDRGIRFGPANVSLNQRMVFTERLSLLLQTGVNLVEALKVMQQQTDEPLVAEVIGALAATISDGESFSVALAKHPKMFSGTYVSLVAAAEAGGFLPQVLDQLLKMDEKTSEMRANVLAALSYPAFLIVFSVLVVVFVLVVIFPKFEDLFASIHDQLPITTVLLLALSSFLRHYWPLVLTGLGLAIWGAVSWKNSEGGKHTIDRIKMTAPLIGPIYVKIYFTQTLGVLGLSLANGVPISVALRACQEVVDNAVFSRFIDDLKLQVNEGMGIAAGFRNSAFVPPMVRQMVATGEQTGNLGFVMARVAEFYERDISKRIAILSKAVEPVMLVVMGVVVGLIVASLILPIFKLSRAIH